MKRDPVKDAAMLREMARKVAVGKCVIKAVKVPLFIPENFVIIEYVKVPEGYVRKKSSRR